jgi:hypothetical protein
MASTINATPTSSGLISTADNSGVLALQTGGTTAVTVDGSQNVGIGTASPSKRLNVKGVTNTDVEVVIQANASNDYNSILSFGDNVDNSGLILYSNYDNHMQFNTNSAERMRIDTNGNVLVGTTNTSGQAGIGFKVLPSATYPQLSMVGSASTNSGTTLEMYSTGAAAYRFYVGYGGTVFATSTTISGISDQRVKENIVDLPDGLASVMALKPRKFDWKEGKGKDIKGDRGFIAQEFETVFPDMIDEWKDPSPEGEEPYKSVRADLIPVLVKAIQELNAKVDAQATTITDLTTRLTALETA